jgi:hypothetical protein
LILLRLNGLERKDIRARIKKARQGKAHLHSDDLQLHHLHLQSLCPDVIGLASEGRTEGAKVWVDVALLLHKTIVGAIDSCGHGHSPVDWIQENILSILPLVVFLGEDGRLEVRGNAGNVEGCARGGSVRDIGSRAHTACAETGEQRSAVGC